MDNQKTSFEQYLTQMAPREYIDIFQIVFSSKCKIFRRYVKKNSKNVEYRIHWGRGEEIAEKIILKHTIKVQFWTNWEITDELFTHPFTSDCYCSLGIIYIEV